VCCEEAAERAADIAAAAIHLFFETMSGTMK